MGLFANSYLKFSNSVDIIIEIREIWGVRVKETEGKKKVKVESEEREKKSYKLVTDSFLKSLNTITV